MNWIQSLYETYEHCRGSVGYSPDIPRPLLPICHISTQTHIEVVIDGNGKFRRARIVDKDDATTIMPATESSAGRAGSKPECHPLSDKLQYLAGDFAKYGGVVTSGFSDDPTKPYRNFVELLTKWCNSPYSHPKARAVLAYIQKKTLMRDLATHKVLLVGDDGKLLSKENAKRDKNAKDIFSVINAQDNAVVRWVVESPDSDEHRAWQDKTLWDSWTNYYLNSRTDTGLCLVMGREQLLTNNHPKFIRREGDNAKLISANDTSGFTFRGRFTTDDQAYGVGLETSQKAHYALTWLISRQGYVDGDLAIVAWATSGVKVIQPTDDPIAALYGDLPPEEDKKADTAQDVALRLKKKIAGYRQEIGSRTDVVVMAVDSATPGRLAIVYYRMLNGSDFLGRIEGWHETCAWRHIYHAVEEKDEKGKTRKRYIPFYGAPAPDAIAEAAYAVNRNGKFELDDKLRKATIKRLLPCIVDGQPIPRDLVESAVRRASNRAGLEGWQWYKTLSIACALFRKFKEGKEKYDMSLDETRTSRDYLYGRLLAIADVLEERTLSDTEKNRPTNATRYMQQFSQRPFRTWKQIHELLTPYLMRQGDKASYYKSLMGHVETLFDPEDFISNKPLTGEYLLSYYCQRQKMWEKKTKSASDETQTPDEK